MPAAVPTPPPHPLPAVRDAFCNPANDRVLRDYLFEVDRQHRSVRILSLRPGQDDRPDHILDAFIAPAGAERRYGPEEIDRLEQEKGELPAPLLAQLVDRPRAVVLGDPGSGKSTLTAWLATALANVRAPGLPAEFFWMVPVPIILKDIAPNLFMHGAWPLTWDDLLAAFLEQPVAKVLKENPDDFAAWVASGQVFFLIDGLDEVSDPARRLALRDALWQGMAQHRHCRWLLTSRIVGYGEAEVHFYREKLTIEDGHVWVAPPELEGLALLYSTVTFPEAFQSGPEPEFWNHHRIASLLYVTPFDDARMTRFLDAWMPARVGEAAGQEKARDLWSRFQRTPEARIIARMPIVLVFAGQVYLYYGNLPQGRTRLYDRIAEAYSGTIPVSKGHDLRYSPEEIQTLLARIGWELQSLRASSEEESAAQEAPSDGMVATRAQLAQWLSAEVRSTAADEAPAALEDFIKYVTRVTGLLLPRGEDRYGFTHLSFQEYYAALYLEQWFLRCVAAGSRKTIPANARWADFDATLLPLAARQDWQEVLVFLAERLSFQPASDFPALLIERLGLTEAQPPKVLARDFDKFLKNPGAYPDPLPAGLAVLGARWSVNPFVHLTGEDRTRLWHRLWLWQYWWSLRGFSGRLSGEGLSSVLLSGTPHSAAALAALPTATDAPPPPGADTLILWNAPALKDLRPLTALTQLSRLALHGCTGLRTVDQLPPSLTGLSLDDCTGLSAVDQLPASLTTLSLRGCTGLLAVDQLPASLTTLYLSGCTGLDAETVRKLKASRKWVVFTPP